MYTPAITARVNFQDEPADSTRESLVPEIPARISRGGRGPYLRGAAIPSVKLWFYSIAKREDLALFIGDGLFVVYFFSGLAGQVDVAQAQVFRERSLEWKALKCDVLGISSRPPDWLQKWVKRLDLPYDLAGDYSLELADRLGLGTTSAGGARIYERQALIVSEGKVQEVFDSVTDRPKQEAARIAAWLKYTR